MSSVRWRVLRSAMVAFLCGGHLAACGGANLGPTGATADAPLIVSAFNSWEELPATCQALLVPGSLRVATLASTGVAWAMAAFKPVPDCSFTMGPASPGGPPRPIRIEQIGPWGREPQPPIGVFQRPPGQGWTMNSEGGKPFPCPAPGGIAPGPGNGALPAELIRKWDLRYATNCAEVSYPMRPR